MSVKRQATSELNHDNWDQDDPSEHEEMGTFQTASKDVLEKRVRKVAKRRMNTENKNVFSGFGGFNKTQPSSFDFLSKLTNGSKNTDSATDKPQNVPSAGLFGSKPPATGLFNATSTPVDSTKTSPAISSPQTMSVFGTNTSPFGTSSLKTIPYKIQSSNDSDSKPKNDNFNSSNIIGSNNIGKSIFNANSSSTPIKASTNNTPAVKETTEKKDDDKKLQYYSKLKGLNESVSDWIKKHVEETPLCILTPIFKDYEKHLKEIQDEYNGPDTHPAGDSNDKNTEDIKPIEAANNANSKSSMFSITTKQNVLGTNQTPGSVNDKPSGFSFGINNKSANEGSPSKISASPQSVSQNTTALAGANAFSKTQAKIAPFSSSPNEKQTGISFGVNNKSVSEEVIKTTSDSSGTSLFSNINSKPSPFGSNSTDDKPFSFGIKPGNNTSTTGTTGGFSFGNNSALAPTSSPFSLGTNTTSTTSAPFSFGAGKPFSFNSNVQQNKTEENKEDNDEEDQPPKVEYTPLVEENSVLDKKCKIFVKKDGNFVDKGVGTLYIKKVEDTGKHQLLVRANTSLGNVMLNLILSSNIPTQRLGKNNVMLVCIPTPNAEPPPTPVLIRVKTSEEADELLETLNKFKA